MAKRFIVVDDHLKYRFLDSDNKGAVIIYFKGAVHIVTCQAHPVLVKKANQMCGSFLLKFFI